MRSHAELSSYVRICGAFVVDKRKQRPLVAAPLVYVCAGG